MCPGQVGHPRVLEVVERIVAACRQHGKIAASHFVSVEMLAELRRCGMQLGGFGAEVRILQFGLGELGTRAGYTELVLAHLCPLCSFE